MHKVVSESAGCAQCSYQSVAWEGFTPVERRTQISRRRKCSSGNFLPSANIHRQVADHMNNNTEKDISHLA